MSYRIYNINHCISFKKTNEEFGGLSNMASGFPIVINDTYIGTSEALYQSIRFTDYPDIQKEIINQKSPMAAKIVAKKYRKDFTRNDWNKRRISIMRWCLQVKLLQNKETFGQLLLDTKNFNIVEESNKDQFWGAKVIKDNFEGTNALGRLLMELREIYRINDFNDIKPLEIPNFYFLGNKVSIILPIDDKEKFRVKNLPSSLFDF